MRSPTNPYFETRLAAERDRRLSDGAFRLLSCICSHRAGRDLDDDFPLPWSLVGRWMDLAKDQSYRLIRQLVEAGYLKLGDLKHCPAERFYFLVPSCRKNAPTGTGTNAPTGSGKNAATSSRKKAAPHTSSSLREGSLKEDRRKVGEEWRAAPGVGGRKEQRPPAEGQEGEENSGLRPIDWDALKREALA